MGLSEEDIYFSEDDDNKTDLDDGNKEHEIDGFYN